MTGGPNGGQHITDVTNASRTLLMNLKTLQWDPVSIILFNNFTFDPNKHLCFGDNLQELLKIFSIDVDALPIIHSSSEVFGKVQNGCAFNDIQICGVSIIEICTYHIVPIKMLINLWVCFLDYGQSAVFINWSNVF